MLKRGKQMNNTKIANELIKLARGIIFPRKSYVPKNSVMVDDVGNTDLEIWTYENEAPNGRIIFGAAAFAGKSNKPLWHYLFKDKQQMKNKIDETIRSRKHVLENKKNIREERKNFRHTLKVGDILYSSWGYDQTNIDFYQVVEAGEKSVKIREIGKKSTDDSHVIPTKDKFIGPSKTKLVSTRNSVKVDYGQYAYVWDGKPKYETPSGFGH